MDETTEEDLVPLGFDEEEPEVYGEDVLRESEEQRDHYRDLLDDRHGARPIHRSSRGEAGAQPVAGRLTPKTLVLGVVVVVVIAGLGFLLGSSGGDDASDLTSPSDAERIARLEKKLKVAEAKVLASKKAQAARQAAVKRKERRAARVREQRRQEARRAAKREASSPGASATTASVPEVSTDSGSSYSYAAPSYSAPAPAPTPSPAPSPTPATPTPATASEAANAFSPLP